MISTISLKQKFFKKGYTGNLPEKYEDLLNLYTSLYGPPDLDNWSKDKLVIKIKEFNYNKPIPSTLPELRKIFLQLYKPTFQKKLQQQQQPRESTIDDFTIAKLKENLQKMGYKGPNKKTKKEWYNLYLEYSTKGKPIEVEEKIQMTVQQLKDELVKMGHKDSLNKKKKDYLIKLYSEYKSGGIEKKVEQPQTVVKQENQMTVQQLKDELVKMGHKDTLNKKKKDYLIKLYSEYKNGGIDKKVEQPPTVVKQEKQMTVQQLKDELVKMGHKDSLNKKKKDYLIKLYSEYKSGSGSSEKKVEQPQVESPVKQLDLENTTINELKHQVKKLGYTGLAQKNKQGWIDVYNNLIDSTCKHVGKFTYSITLLGMTKKQIETKFQGKNVGIVYTVCKDKKCTFTIDDAKKYKEFIFTMQNSKGTYDGMEINGHQVLTIDELPENLYDKLIGKCGIKDVSEEVLKFIEKIEKKTKNVCDNLLDNYKIIPIDKDGNCFFQAIGNALNIPMNKVREMMANKLTQKLVDIRNEFGHSNKTLEQYKNELLKDGSFVSDYDVEQLFPITFPGTGLIILNMNSGGGCDITCSSNLLENKNKYIVLLFQRNPSQDKDDDAHYDLISINSKPVLSFGDLSKKLVQHVHKQCKTIHLNVSKILVQESNVEKEPKVQESKVEKESEIEKPNVVEESEIEKPQVQKEPKVEKPQVQKESKVEKLQVLNNTKLQKEPEVVEEPKIVEKLELMKKEDVKKLLKEKGYIGILPKYKTELIEIYNKLYNESNKKEIETKEPVKPLEKMTLQELQTELQKKNITKYLPRTKTELIKLYNADRCDPVEEQWCSGDKICDLRNNVCMDKVDIKPTKNTSIVFETMNDHPIAGTSANLYQLKHTIKNKKQIEPISLTMPTSVEGDNGMIKVQSIDELKQTLLDLAQQNSFYKLISQLV
jgi:hypothetical protein